MPPFTSLRTSARVYIGCLVALGAAAVLLSAADLAARRPSEPLFYWLIALAVASALFTVRVREISARVSVSETFTFTSVLLYGSAAGTLVVALDALIISLKLERKRPQGPYKTAFNMAAPSLAIWVAAEIFFAVSHLDRAGLRPGTDLRVIASIRDFVLPVVGFALLYFALNSCFIATAIALERHLSPLHVWRSNFPSVSLNFIGSASLAIVLVAYVTLAARRPEALLIILPQIAISYFNYKNSHDRVLHATQHVNALNSLYLSTIESLAMAIDAGDQITHGHIRRVQIAAVRLAESLGVHDAALLKAIEAAALLHDIGKLAVPEHILNKPGRLTDAEFEQMKRHAPKGAEILSSIEFPYPVVPIVRHHHENWDGTGYPDGLLGTDIPIGARILSVVDCYDALVSDRPYRPRLPPSEAIRILQERRGKMYDPVVVDIFLGLLRELPELEPPEPDDHIYEHSRGAEPTVDSTIDNKAGDRSQSDSGPIPSNEIFLLHDLTLALVGRTRLPIAVDILASHLLRVLRSSACLVFSYEQPHDLLQSVHRLGKLDFVPASFALALGERVSGWAAAHKTTIINADPALDFLGLPASRLRSCASVPLLIDCTLVGVMTFYSESPGAFRGDDTWFLEAAGGYMAQILRGISGSERAQADSYDPLTGLPNRRRLSEVSAGVSAFARTSAVLLVHMDGLRFVSARQGASARDIVVSLVAQTLADTLRSSDILFRYGPDEFLVVLNSTDRSTAMSIALRTEAAVRGHSCVLPDGALYFPSVTISLASAPGDGGSWSDLANTAKERLGRPRTDRGANCAIH